MSAVETITDSATETVIYDSSWPTLEVADFHAVVSASDDLAAYESGTMAASDFIAAWGIHPDADFTITTRV